MRMVRSSVLSPLVLLLCALCLSAQDYSLHLPPQPPAELWKWASGEADIMLRISGIPPGAGNARVRLAIRLNGRPAAETGEETIGLQELAPEAMLHGPQFISLDNVTYRIAGLRKEVERTGRLPAGLYEVCIIVDDLQQECARFDLIPIPPPEPLVPESGDTIEGPPPLFEWTDAAPLPFGTIPHYRLTIREVYRTQSPTDAFRGNRTLYDEVFAGITSIPLPTLLESLRPGATYVWSVQALDERGEILSTTGEWGEPRTFVVRTGSGTTSEGYDPDDPSLLRPPPPSDQLLFTPTSSTSDYELDPLPDWVDTIGNINLVGPRLDGSDTMGAGFYGVIDSLLIVDRREEGGTRYWSGRMLGRPESYAIFVGRGTLIIGNILRNDTLYLIRGLGSGASRLIRVDPSALPVDAPPIRPDLPNDSLPTLGYTNTDPPDRIDLMILYTPEALAKGKSESLMELEIELALEELNLSLAESGLDLRAVPTHISRLDIEEPENSRAALDLLRRNDEVARLRNEHRADLVFLIVGEDGGVPGRSFILPDLHPWYESFGFAVVGREWLGLGTLMHEFGHPFGAGHDCVAPDDREVEGRELRSRGYVDTVDQWGSIMAQRTEGRRRIPRWSDPSGEYRGRPLGNRNPAGCETCNACTVEEAALLVANYRSASAEATGVWLKDTWEDTGEEPHRHGVDSGRYGWESPYIWTRNEPDSGEIRLPRAQSVTAGERAYLYVMLHNGGGDSTGLLEVWHRPMTLGGDGGDQWQRTDTLSITLPPYQTDVVALPRGPLPTSPGSWLVRFLPSNHSRPDLLSALADSSPLSLALAHNNVALRNIEIVPLYDGTPRAARTISLGGRAERGERNNRVIEIRQEELGLDRAIPADDGIVLTVRFDPETAGAIDRSSVSGAEWDEAKQGFRTTGSVARFRLSDLPNSTPGEITLRFESTDRPRNYWRREYPVRILLLDRDEIVDGATLLLRTREVE